MENRISLTPAGRTRRRRTLACTSCRQKKLRCDRQQPCSSCTRSKDISNVCSYHAAPFRGARVDTRTAVSQRREATPQPAGAHDRTNDVNPVVAVRAPDQAPQHVRSSSHEIRDGQSWYSSNVANLLFATPPPATGSHGQANQGPIETQGGISRLLQTLAHPINAVMVKTRYISPSSWLYSIFLVPHSLAWLERLNEEAGECFEILQTCKCLSKRLRSLQTIPWTHGEYGKLIPGRAVADTLVSNYLQHFETIHRILHVPSFQERYEALWEDPSSAPTGFVIQVQLCLALGALFYDDNFSLRPQAMQWVREAGTWLESSAKPRLVISTIQTMCLYRLARESMQGTYGDRVWILSGTLIRAAMSIGLHRDPAKLPGIPRAQAEMRRRLWTTVLELALSSCLDPGAAPLISLDDFDCALPSNFNDLQLKLDVEDNPVPHCPDKYTDSSLQIALGRSLSMRLAIARFCSGLDVNTYEATLKLSNEYATACRSLAASLRSMRPQLSDFQRQYCEMLMCRYIFALHIPYLVISAQNPSYIVSRKACVDAALSLAHSSLPTSSTQDPLLAAVQAMNVVSAPGDDFVRLCVCGSGPYRSVLFQALMVIAADLIATASERQAGFCWSLSATSDANLFMGDMRALELLALLRVAADWTRQRMRAGQCVNKDHLFVTLAVATIEAFMNGTVVKEALKVSGRAACLEVQAVLERLTAGSNADGEVSEAQFSSEEDDLLGIDDVWLMETVDFNIDFLGL